MADTEAMIWWLVFAVVCELMAVAAHAVSRQWIAATVNCVAAVAIALVLASHVKFERRMRREAAMRALERGP